MNGETVKFPPLSKAQMQAVSGSAGVNSQVPGVAATVSSLAGATGGFGKSKIIETGTK